MKQNITTKTTDATTKASSNENNEIKKETIVVTAPEENLLDSYSFN